MQLATHQRSSARRAFTLIELLVVIGIIALLVGILVPTIIGSMKKARKVRAAMDMQAIRTALDAYKTDFNGYPSVEIPNTGFAVLCKALIAPGPAAGPLPSLGAAPYGTGTYTSSGTPGQLGYTEYVAVGKQDASGNY